MDGVVVREPDGQQRTITANAVVLACGGFEGDPEMLTQYTGEDADDLPIIVPGIKYNRGAGILMAMEIGADTAGQFDMVHAELVDPGEDAPLGHLGPELRDRVNENCERFHDEGEEYLFRHHRVDRLRHLALSEPEVVLHHRQDRDGSLRGSWVYETAALPPEQSDSIGGLAEKLGLDPTKLEETVSEFNGGLRPRRLEPGRNGR